MAHLNSHNKQYTSRFQCKFCDYKGVDNWNLRRHIERKHNFASGRTETNLEPLITTIDGGDQQLIYTHENSDSHENNDSKFS